MTVELTEDPLHAAKVLEAGGLVAFPTETVYGLGVDATNAAAVERLFAVKGRPTNNPLIVHIADAHALASVGCDVPELAVRLLDHFAPGPVTVVVPKRPEIVSAVTAGLATVGVRVPDHEPTRAMLRACGRPIAAPSANRSGRPSATTYTSVLEDFGDAIDMVLMSDPARIGLESTVVDCLSRPPRVLRPGGLTLEMLQSVEPSIVMTGHSAQPNENSPGRLHPHYRPAATVVLFEDAGELQANSSAAYLGLGSHREAEGFGWHRTFDSATHYAHEFYEALREVDRRGLRIVYCQRVPDAGPTAALADRLTRAAGLQ